MHATAYQHEARICFPSAKTPGQEMFELTAAAAVAKAVLARVSSDVTGAVIRGQQDRRTLEQALEEAWIATAADFGDRLGRFDVNIGFLEHEGADEIAKLLLPGAASDPWNLATAAVRHSGRDAIARARLATQLEVPFQRFLENLTVALGKHDRFRERLHKVAATRPLAAVSADLTEFLSWIVDSFAYLQTAGIGTTEYVQLPLQQYS